LPNDYGCGRSSGVEHNLAKVRVGRSIRLARSNFSTNDSFCTAATALLPFRSDLPFGRHCADAGEKLLPNSRPESRASSTLQSFSISSHELAAKARLRAPLAPAVHIMLKCIRNVIYIDLFAITVNGLTTFTMQQSS